MLFFSPELNSIKVRSGKNKNGFLKITNNKIKQI